MPYTAPLNTDPNRPDGDSVVIIYNYIPSLAFGAVGVAAFGLVAVCHLYWWKKSKGLRWFEGLIVFGCGMEMIGYIFRVLSSSHPYTVKYFVIQYFMIVCAPVLFSAALYLSLSSAIGTDPVNSRLIPVKPRVFVTTFIVIDVLTTILQVAGAALIGVSESAYYNGKSTPLTPEQANDILLAGLALQVASFTVFLGLLTWVVIKTSKDRHGYTIRKSYLALVYLTSGMIYTRTIFRLAETAQGLFGAASSSEVLFGVFEFAPVVSALLVWAIRPLIKEIRLMKGCGNGSNGEIKTERAV